MCMRTCFKCNVYTGGNIQTVSPLTDKQARKDWEKIFNEHYIRPVLTSLDGNLAKAMDRVANDDSQGYLP